MPFARVDLPSTVPESAVATVSDAVHRSLVQTFNVPEDDRFQVLHRYAPGAVICAPKYLDIQHGSAVVFVQITCNEGRTVQMKKALFKALAASIAGACGIPPSDVIVSLVEIKKENWSFGNGLAQYAPAD